MSAMFVTYLAILDTLKAQNYSKIDIPLSKKGLMN